MSPSAENLKNWCNLAKKACLQGREVLLEHYGKLNQVSKKEKAGLVSEADLESEKQIKQVLLAQTPDFEFLGEEEAFARKGSLQGLTPSQKGRWVLDPLDGTTNYVHGFPIFCISLALEIDGAVQVAVVDVPILKQTYWGFKGGGAFCDETPIRVSGQSQLSDALLATGFLSSDHQQVTRQVEVFSQLIKEARGIRRPGAAAYDLCMVAAGVFDAFWETGLQPWDMAAGALLVEEAGGQVSQMTGEAFTPYVSGVVASNGPLHSKLLPFFD